MPPDKEANHLPPAVHPLVSEDVTPAECLPIRKDEDPRAGSAEGTAGRD